MNTSAPEPIKPSDRQQTDSGPRARIGSAPLPVVEEPTLFERTTRMVLGAPRDLRDRALFHSLTLVSFLAWIG